jgi:uncharacterized protein YcbX
MVTPAVPFETLHIVHVLGQAKHKKEPVRTTDGQPAPVDVWGQRIDRAATTS